ncbi:MAG: apolipoprotein N-acyltransferase [Terricaulis sp.]
MTVPPNEAAMSRIESWFAQRTRWQRRGLAFLAGALATLGHAPFHVIPFYVAAIVILVWLLDVVAAQHAGRSIVRKMWAGASTAWWFAVGHYLTGFYWIGSAFIERGADFAPYAAPAVLAFAAVLALFWMIAGALAMLLWTRDARRVAAFAVAVFVAEWLRGNMFTGFPWLLPGYIWSPGEPVSQLASIFGIYGLSLLTLLAAAAPAVLADGRSTGAMRFAPSIAAALAVGMSWGWGAERMAHAPIEPPGAQPVVRVADSGLSQKQKWCEVTTREEFDACYPQQEWRVLARYLAASGPPDTSRADILVWPEGAIPTLNFFALDNPQFMAALGRGLGDRALVMGITRCEPNPAVCQGLLTGATDPDAVRLYNSGAVIDGVSGVTRLGQVYDKHHLVPGGEYIPFWSVLRNLNIGPLQQIGSGFTPGPAPTRLVLPGAPPAVVLICYEAIFPGMTPREDRPGWIINISNDAWFGDPKLFSGPWQHWDIARYRTIEEGLPMARAASGGISGIVDAFGRAVRSTYRRGGYAESQIPPALVVTTFARYGNIVLFLTLCLTLALRFLPPWRADGDRRR